MPRWTSLLLAPGLMVVFFGMQVAFYAASALIDGRAHVFAPDMTPTIQLANNLSVAATAFIALAVTARCAKVPWRILLSHSRPVDLRRLWVYGAVSAILVAAGVAATALAAPATTGWTGFGLSTTTWALLAVTLLTTPLQAAGEELIFRSALMPTVASWVRAVRPAIGLGIAVSSILFALAHVPTNPWLFAHLLVMGAGGPSYLILMAVNVAVVSVVVWRERILRARSL